LALRAPASTAREIRLYPRARLETLQAGVPVFYRDWKRNLDIMEQPDGRKFEVCFIADPLDAPDSVMRFLTICGRRRSSPG
jgi:hypothetical protein